MSIVHQKDWESPSAFECAQSGCRECQEALVRRHEGLVHTVLRRQSRDGLAYEELLQEGRVALWKAVLGFDPQRGVAFSTYAGRAIRNRIWSAVEHSKRPQGWLKPREAPIPLALAEDRLWQVEVWTALAEAVNDSFHCIKSYLPFTLANGYGNISQRCPASVYSRELMVQRR